MTTFLDPVVESSGGAGHLVLVTPSDDDDLEHPSRSIWLLAAGAVKVTTIYDETLTIPSGMLAAGISHPLLVKRIWETGTDALPGEIMVGY